MPTTDEAALRQRLNQFAGRITRAEIARKTGTSVMNVSRYLSGTRVPAAFCMALVREFGINPNWLMAGEGAPFLSDLAGEHGHMAGNLLELVEAMSAVSRMKLGSLAGRDHMLLLRQLNDALGTYERLRGKLNEQGRGIMVDVLREFSGALDRMDMTRATALRKAAEQVARLCDDEALSGQLLTLQGHHSYLAGRLEESLALMRRRFGQALATGRIDNEETAKLALRITVVLHDSGHRDQARAMAEATLALGGNANPPLQSVANTGVFLGYLKTGQGDVRGALELATRWAPVLQGRPREVAQASMVRMQMLAGLLTPQEAVQAPGLPQPKFVFIAGFAAILEQAPVLQVAARFFESAPGREAAERNLIAGYCGLIARAIEKPAPAILKECAARRARAESVPGNLPELDVYEAAVLRLMGRTAPAAKLAAGSHARMEAGTQPMELLVRVLHWRNLLALGRPEHRDHARDRLSALVGQGCLGLQPLLDSAQPGPAGRVS